MKIDRRHALAAGLVGAAAFAGDARGRLPEATAEPITTLQGPDDGTVLTEGTNFAVAPSPDGKQLALDVAGAIWLLPVTGGQARRLTDPMLDASQPDWLPDGKHLVFQAYTQGNFQLWMVDVHSGELRQVTTGPFDHREPAVSPDGAAVAFVTDRSGHCRLAILDLNSGARRDWADLPGEASQPAWSADGRQIVCVSDGRRIVAASQGGEARVIATLPRSPSPPDRGWRRRCMTASIPAKSPSRSIRPLCGPRS